MQKLLLFLISLCHIQVTLSSKTVNVNIYDSGTDSGSSFTSANQVTNSPVPIFIITDAPLATNGVVPAMGTMTFERIDN